MNQGEPNVVGSAGESSLELVINEVTQYIYLRPVYNFFFFFNGARTVVCLGEHKRGSFGRGK